MRRAHVYFQDRLAGLLTETEKGYSFIYHPDYLKTPQAKPISFSLPLQTEPFESPQLFPFFDGLIPEGWYLDIVSKTLKIDPEDRFGILLATAGHTIGAVTVHPAENEKEPT